MRSARLMMAAMAAMAVSACGTGAASGNAADREVGMHNAQSVADEIGITLPAVATVEHADRIEGRDNAARMALVMPAADWDALRSKLLPQAADRPTFSPDANFHLGPDEAGWEPAKAQGLSTVQTPWRNGAEVLNIGYAPAAKGQVRVFLFWHQL